MALGSMVRRIIPDSALHRILPNIGLASEARWEARALALHYMRARSARKRFRGRSGILANIGCGPRPMPGWENLDLQAKSGITCWDCRRGLPFEDATVAVIFSEHVFEHLERPRSTGAFLKECLRCLQRGGILRLVVPDAGMYLDAYAARDWNALARNRPLEPREGGYHDHWLHETYRTRMEVVNAVFRQRSEHKYAYDAETLMLDLEAAGFTSVHQQAFGRSLVPEAAIDSPERAPESLYVEGVK